MTSTHTYAVLKVSRRAWEEIAAHLRAANYDHVFHENEIIDCHGIALQPLAIELDPGPLR